MSLGRNRLSIFRCRSALAAVLSLSLGAAVPAWPEDGAGPLPLTWVADIPLPGRPTRLDYVDHDPQRHLLFIAHLGDSALVVVDTRSQSVVATVPNLSQVHGVLVIPELNRVYATATKAHQVVAIGEDNFQTLATIPGGVFPDGLAYAPEVHKLYVSDKVGGALVVIDVNSHQAIGSLPLGGEAGNVRYDMASRHLFVNVRSRNELVEIDPATDQILGRYPLPGAEVNHGLLIDPVRRLAFVACEGNSRLLVVDLRTMAVVSSHPVGANPDVLAFDPGLDRLYVASESGVVSVFSGEATGFQKIGEGQVAPHAHSIAVDRETHRVYLPIENIDKHPVLRVMEPAH